MTRNSPPPEPLINGVQIASLSERVIGVPAFISYKVASEHDVFYKGGVSSISKMVGIPLLVMRIKHPEEYHPAQPNYEYGFNDNYPANESVEHLMAGSENEDEWMDACCVVVVRADKKPLEPQHVRALVGFIKLMDPYLTFTMADPSDMTTPGEFKEYYMDHCADEKRGTPAPSPYPHARRTTARGELSRMSTQTLMQAAESERELAMAREIGRLRRELRKAS